MEGGAAIWEKFIEINGRKYFVSLTWDFTIFGKGRRSIQRGNGEIRKLRHPLKIWLGLITNCSEFGIRVMLRPIFCSLIVGKNDYFLD